MRTVRYHSSHGRLDWQNEDHPYPCVVCGRPTDGSRTVVMVEGGRYLAPVADITPEDERDAGFMGGYDIGPDCARRAKITPDWFGTA